MRCQTFLVMLVAGMLVSSCDSHKNYLELQSIDCVQIVRRDAEQVQIFPNSILDATLLQKMMEEQAHYAKTFPTICQSAPDSTAFVFRLDWKMRGAGDEMFVSVFGVFNKKRITSLYLLEVGQGALYWQLSDDSFGIVHDSTAKKLKVKAVMRAIDFQCSFTIRFPYIFEGERSGLYDYDINRYMSVECEFSLDADQWAHFFE